MFECEYEFVCVIVRSEQCILAHLSLLHILFVRGPLYEDRLSQAQLGFFLFKNVSVLQYLSTVYSSLNLKSISFIKVCVNYFLPGVEQINLAVKVLFWTCAAHIGQHRIAQRAYKAQFNLPQIGHNDKL